MPVERAVPAKGIKIVTKLARETKVEDYYVTLQTRCSFSMEGAVVYKEFPKFFSLSDRNPKSVYGVCNRSDREVKTYPNIIDYTRQ